MITLRACDCPPWPAIRQLQAKARRAQRAADDLEKEVAWLESELTARRGAAPSRAERARRILTRLATAPYVPESHRCGLVAALRAGAAPPDSSCHLRGPR